MVIGNIVYAGTVVNVDTNIDWYATTSANWIQLEQYDGSQLTLLVSANDSQQARSEVVYIYRSDNGAELGTVVVNQAAKVGSEEYYDTREYVDLGLPSGLLWATCNVGASSPEEYGYYFSWGETNYKSEYSSTSCWVYYDISGDESYDVARNKWGGTWRMPTYEEYVELLNNCSWSFTTWNGGSGYLVTGPNGNSIFLPASGSYYGTRLEYLGNCGFYWTSTPNGDEIYELYFDGGVQDIGWSSRANGHAVRPVMNSKGGVDVDVDDFGDDMWW